MEEVSPAQAAVAANRRFSNVFYGWWMVMAGGGLQLLQSALLGQAYGAYVVLLRDDFGWSKTLLAGASSLREAESGFTGPLQGWLLDRFGPRAVPARASLSSPSGSCSSARSTRRSRSTPPSSSCRWGRVVAG